MSDDELDAVFEEHFKCKKKHEEVNSDVEEHDVSFDGEGGEAETTPSETNPDSEEEDEEEVEEEVADDTIGTVRIKTDDFSKTFSVNISHGEILCALYNLIAQYDESDNDYYFIRDVYDAYFLMQGWCTGKIYKQSYVVEDENVALSGERQEMFEIILTESEKLAIEKMRENYAELVEFKEKYDLDVARSAKQSALNADDYSDIAGTEAFENLVKNIDSYSVEELCEKADRMLGEFYKQNKKNFNFDVGSADKQRSVSINLNAKPSKKRKAYAGLFDE